MEALSNIRVTAVVPVYNKCEYVEQSLQSLFNQDFEGLEVLAVDDGSTDGSGDVLDRLAAEHPCLRVIHTENGGVTAARRVGVEQARGAYVVFADADDMYTMGAIQKLYNAITSTGADEVIGNYVVQTGQVMRSGFCGFVDADVLLRQLFGGKTDFCVLWGVIFRRELLDDCLTAPSTIRSGEDVLMQMLCLLKRPRVFFIPCVVYFYNMGLPNDRTLNLTEQRAYDDFLRQRLQPRWDEWADYFVLRQLKEYEKFIADGQVEVLNSYFRPLRRQLSRRIPLSDRIAILLPPSLAYFPICWKKNLHPKIKLNVHVWLTLSHD